MKKILLTIVIAPSTATAFASDYTGHQIYSDKNFERSRVKAVKTLENRGYRTHGVDAGDLRDRPVLKVEAFRDGREYGTILSCPDSGIIKERINY